MGSLRRLLVGKTCPFKRSSETEAHNVRSCPLEDRRALCSQLPDNTNLVCVGPPLWSPSLMVVARDSTRAVFSIKTLTARFLPNTAIVPCRRMVLSLSTFSSVFELASGSLPEKVKRLSRLSGQWQFQLAGLE
jgi:hypothetical protein